MSLIDEIGGLNPFQPMGGVKTVTEQWCINGEL